MSIDQVQFSQIIINCYNKDICFFDIIPNDSGVIIEKDSKVFFSSNAEYKKIRYHIYKFFIRNKIKNLFKKRKIQFAIISFIINNDPVLVDVKISDVKISCELFVSLSKVVKSEILT